jgi:hypothetical protein
MPLVLAGVLAIAIDLIVIALEVLLIAILIILALYALFIIGKAIWEWVSTLSPPLTPPIEQTWDEAVPIPVPAPPPAIPWPKNGKEKIDPKALPKTEDLIETIAKTEALTRGPWSVYDLHVIDNSRRFNNYTSDRVDKSGNILKTVQLPPLDIYKYGRTQKMSVLARYAESLKHASNKKDQYIYNLMTTGRIAPTEWYLYKYNLAVASALEVSLIQGYKALHGFRPAANPINA